MASLKTKEHAHIRIGNAEAAVWGLEQSCPAASIEHGDGYSLLGRRTPAGWFAGLDPHCTALHARWSGHDACQACTWTMSMWPSS